ncbi:hypothetical protein PRRU23_10570 [Segatella bryantii]|uniref:Uncharacterized protein n=1 Tax=Segatella bryantii TaxID=77095 RepID=A0AA37HVT7_SEGBR|nr:hypothetical protein PRRU23_10570 [Segatella bryantii]
MAITVNATGQDGDIIYIDGTRWELLGRPICVDSLLYHDLRAVLPSERSILTSNWDGFTGYWSIKQNVLYLDSIRTVHSDSDTKDYMGSCIPAATLFRVFKKHVAGDCIVGSWLTKNIRVAKGKVINYQHIGFERNYEDEQIISIDKGVVTGKKVYHNYVIDGFSFDKVKDNAELRRLFPIHVEQYPELANAKRIVFCINKARVNSQGNLVECEVKVLNPSDNQQLGTEMEGLLKAYHPWKVSFINGEFRAVGIDGWSFPYLLDK